MRKNVTNLQKALVAAGLDVYIIPITDAHMGEYLPAYSKVIRWVSGFSGSAGILVLTADFAGLWTDSRYFVQAETELADSGVQLMKLRVPHTPEYLEWLSQTLKKGAKIGLDGRNMSRSAFGALYKMAELQGFQVDFEVDLINPLWTDRPAAPEGAIFNHPIRFAGQNSKTKIKAVRTSLSKKKVDYLLLSSLDDIAWLTNLRGTDIPHLPVFTAHLVVGLKKTALFVSAKKLSESIEKELSKAGIDIFPYEAVTDYLGNLPKSATVLLDPVKISQSLPGALPDGIRVEEGIAPTTLIKACKNEVEQANLRKTMVTDGIVLTKYYYWIETQIDKGTLTEIDAQNQLKKLRKEHGAIDESFGPISAYAAHAALPHYSAKPTTNVPLKRENVYLLDSGGQYLGGTTDTTRVLAYGESTEQEKLDYTLVLKGMIACSTQKFPAGTQGYQLDALARSAIWNAGVNYGHGTGHGVGFCLDVHEGPQGIRPSAMGSSKDSAFQVGMVTSVEPGIYRVGHHGIRIENLVLCVEAEKNEFDSFLTFETLTIAPICTNLVEKSLLTKEELKWLRTYNKWVLRKIGRKLTAEERAWLVRMTKI